MKVLGISALYHDSAAALISDGKIVAAAQEERFTRKKHDPALPKNAVAYCLDEAGVQFDELDFIAFYDKPFLKFERLLETYLAFAPRGYSSFAKAIPVWVGEKLFQKHMLRQELEGFAPNFDWDKKLLFSEHHLSHAASAFFPSPFSEALVLTMDGVGEWATTSVAVGRGRKLEIVRELHFPHSLGLLYSAFTYYCGFKVNSGEYKLMGLAPYGEPKFRELILSNLIDVKSDGSFRLSMRYFNYCTGLTMTNDRFADLFGGPARKPDEPLTKRHMDIAASIQSVLEQVVITMARSLRKEFGIENLCLAGGVALNCVANGMLLRDRVFTDIWIQPAAGDAGGSVGAALAAYHGYLGLERPGLNGAFDHMQGGLLGPKFDMVTVKDRLTAMHARYEVVPDEELFDRVAEDLAEGKAIGWFQGRMEFGPRALGGRSIIGDPRSPTMQRNLNLKIKFRESFRPFAPSVLREDVSNWFDLDADSPYMLMVAPVRADRTYKMTDEQKRLFGIDKLNIPRSEIPSVTHVDYSARIQTVRKEVNPRYHSLIERFKQKTGCPVVVNTSFNVRGEPIVCTPDDAFRCFMGTDLDVLVVENCYLRKADQDPKLKLDYKDRFELD